MTALGVPMLLLTWTYSSPGYCSSSARSAATNSSGVPANHAPTFM